MLLLLQATTALLLPERFARRDVIGGAGAAAIASLPSAAGHAAGAASGLITILGASGKTGALCVDACLRRGQPVRALTRSGQYPPGVGSSPLLTIGQCDVRDESALNAGLTGSTAVIYAASASKLGGNAEAIDNLGAAAAAKAALATKVKRFVLISSTAVTRPESLGFKFTNAFVPGYARGVMDQKLLGEKAVRTLYDADQSSCTYAIVRPGGLEESSDVVGAAGLEVSQGDALAGVVSRPDLAAFTVELARSEALTFDTALEIYTTQSAQPCEGRFKPLLADGRVRRLHGASWRELLAGIKAEGAYFVP